MFHNFSTTQPRTNLQWTNLGEAASLAFQIYATLMKKGTEIPYASRLLGVAAITIDFGGDEDEGCAALLHGPVKYNGPKWYSIIEQRCGSRVASIVHRCTPVDVQPRSQWRARKEAYLAHLEKAYGDVLLVLAADKLYSARAILSGLQRQEEPMLTRFRATQERTLWYYDLLAGLFTRRLSGPLALELSEAVSRMHNFSIKQASRR